MKEYRTPDQFVTITTLTSLLVAVAVAGGGVFLLYLSHTPYMSTRDIPQALCRDLGSLCVVVVAMSFLWELLGKRALGSEMLARAGLSREIADAGLLHVASSYEQVQWEQLFANARELDLFFTYGRSWRTYHESRIRELAFRSNARLRVVLPDPDDRDLMKALGKRFRKSANDQAADIREAADFFVRVAVLPGGQPSPLEIWYTTSEPTVSIYRFDDLAVAALYPHKEKVSVPHLVCRRPGTLYRYVDDQLRVLTDAQSGISRKFV